MSSEAEARAKVQLRKAMDRHIQSGNGRDSATWQRVMELDGKLRALRRQA